MAGAGGEAGLADCTGAATCVGALRGAADSASGAACRRPWRLIASRRRAKSRRISSLVILPSGSTSTVGSGCRGGDSPRDAAAAARVASSAW
eukprot:8971886-Alexandrium_andersonii.AAC.1